MKILLVQHQSFINGRGGTEKICSFLANHFCSLGYDVEVATNENVKGKEVFPLDDKIKLINIYSDDIEQVSLYPVCNYKGRNPFLWIKNKIRKKKAKFLNKRILKQIGGKDELYKFNLRNRAKRWKKFIETSKPDLIITMSIGSLLEITFENNYDIPIINSTNGRPDYDYTDVLWYRSGIEMQLLKEAYKKLTAIQVLFDNYKSFLPSTFRGYCKVIGNPIPQTDEGQIKIHNYQKQRYIISNIATLNVSCKQQDVAIRVFHQLSSQYPDWELHFWGEGNDFAYLKRLIEQKKLTNRVFLRGFTNAPLEMLKESDIYIFPSKYEGFPLSLSEAMSVGLPSVGFATCSGVNQLIQHLENGFLANDEQEMENYLKILMENPDLRQKMGFKAHQMVNEFAPEKIKKQWEDLVSSVMNRR